MDEMTKDPLEENFTFKKLSLSTLLVPGYLTWYLKYLTWLPQWTHRSQGRTLTGCSWGSRDSNPGDFQISPCTPSTSGRSPASRRTHFASPTPAAPPQQRKSKIKNENLNPDWPVCRWGWWRGRDWCRPEALCRSVCRRILSTGGESCWNNRNCWRCPQHPCRRLSWCQAMTGTGLMLGLLHHSHRYQSGPPETTRTQLAWPDIQNTP